VDFNEAVNLSATDAKDTAKKKGHGEPI